MKTIADCMANKYWPKFRAAFEERVGQIGGRDHKLIISCFHWFALGMETMNAIWTSDECPSPDHPPDHPPERTWVGPKPPVPVPPVRRVDLSNRGYTEPQVLPEGLEDLKVGDRITIGGYTGTVVPSDGPDCLMKIKFDEPVNLTPEELRTVRTGRYNRADICRPLPPEDDSGTPPDLR